MRRSTPTVLRPLKGIRVLSLALNLPGPAALMRCRAMGATCVKLEPPSGDPMGLYNKPAYAQLHEGAEAVGAPFARRDVHVLIRPGEPAAGEGREVVAGEVNVATHVRCRVGVLSVGRDAQAAAQHETIVEVRELTV